VAQFYGGNKTNKSNNVNKSNNSKNVKTNNKPKTNNLSNTTKSNSIPFSDSILANLPRKLSAVLTYNHRMMSTPLTSFVWLEKTDGLLTNILIVNNSMYRIEDLNDDNT
jgi:hypothetical protein